MVVHIVSQTEERKQETQKEGNGVSTTLGGKLWLGFLFLAQTKAES